MEHFVFVEFADDILTNFFKDLRDALQARTSTKPIHITVRGPYRGDAPGPREFETLQRELVGLGVRITGSGLFKIPKGYVVFLRAESLAFRKIWWKPDFPRQEFGIKPHLSIFETVRLESAKAVETFLKSQRINIHTNRIRLALYTAGQEELLPEQTGVVNTGNAVPTYYGGIDTVKLLERARTLGATIAAH